MLHHSPQGAKEDKGVCDGKGMLRSVASVVAERLIDKDSLVGEVCVVDKGVSCCDAIVE
jgi:hypothetical protein